MRCVGIEGDFMRSAATFEIVDRSVKTWIRDLSIAFIGSVLVGMTSWISVYLPISPVPICFTVTFLLYLSAIMGARRAALMAISYLVQGLMGYPVFASGNATILTLLGPTGGYLLAYPFAAYTTGFLFERAPEKTPLQLLKCMAVGNLAIYCGGFAWLSHLIGVKKALFAGVAPFILGDVFKAVLLAKLPTRVHKLFL